MRLFAINEEEVLTEYAPQDFKVEHREKIPEEWLAANPDCILHTEQLLVIVHGYG